MDTVGFDSSVWPTREEVWNTMCFGSDVGAKRTDFLISTLSSRLL